jgi:hypothetical protein
MRAKAIVFAASLLSIVAWAATPFSSDGLTIYVPPGFEGPLTQGQAGAKAIGFAKQSINPAMKTLLQVTVLDPGPNAIPSSLTQAELADGAKTYVLDFVKGVERSRTNYSQGNVVSLNLGGIPSAKIAWKGSVNGIDANGVMYCVISKGKLYSFHTQDAGAQPTSNMREAMSAIESVAFR